MKSECVETEPFLQGVIAVRPVELSTVAAPARRVHLDPFLVNVVVDNVIANALEHGDGTTPVVMAVAAPVNAPPGHPGGGRPMMTISVTNGLAPGGAPAFLDGPRLHCHAHPCLETS